MSHFLLSKRIWLIALGLSCLFFVLAYLWFYYTNQWVLQARKMESKPEEVAGIVDKILPDWWAETIETVWTETEKVQTEDPELTFPCRVQLVDDVIGVFNEAGQLCRTMRQVSEYLSDRDREELLEGILAQNDYELIMVYESFHLQ